MLMEAINIYSSDKKHDNHTAAFVSGASKCQKIPFGIMSMASKADCLQKGEPVKFQVCTFAQTGQKMACVVVPQRRALVECVKDQVVFAFRSMCRDLQRPRNKVWSWSAFSLNLFSPFVVWFHHIRSRWKQETVFPRKRSARRFGAPDGWWGGVHSRPQSAHREI